MENVKNFTIGILVFGALLGVVFCLFGYLIYCCIHDKKIKEEEKENSLNEFLGNVYHKLECLDRSFYNIDCRLSKIERNLKNVKKESVKDAKSN